MAKYRYCGPASVMQVGSKTYHRADGECIDVEMPKEMAQRLVNLHHNIEGLEGPLSSAQVDARLAAGEKVETTAVSANLVGAAAATTAAAQESDKPKP